MENLGGEATVHVVCLWSTLPRSAIKSTLILLPLLGVTWIIGVLAVNINTIVFAALFIIFNAFQVINSSINLGVCISSILTFSQGVFILVLHVLRNDVVSCSLPHYIYIYIHIFIYIHIPCFVAMAVGQCV